MARTVTGASSAGKPTYRGSSGGSSGGGYDAAAAARAAEEEARRQKRQAYNAVVNVMVETGKKILGADKDLNSAKRALVLYSAGSLSETIKNKIEKTQEGINRIVNGVNTIIENAKQKIQENGGSNNTENLKPDYEELNKAGVFTGFSCDTTRMREEVLKPLQSANAKLKSASDTSKGAKSLEGCENVKNIPSDVNNQSSEIDRTYQEVEKFIANVEEIERQNSGLVALWGDKLTEWGTKIGESFRNNKEDNNKSDSSAYWSNQKDDSSKVNINEILQNITEYQTYGTIGEKQKGKYTEAEIEKAKETINNLIEANEQGKKYVEEESERNPINKIYNFLKENSIPAMIEKIINEDGTTTNSSTRTPVTNTATSRTTVVTPVNISRTPTTGNKINIPIITSRTTTEGLFDMMKEFANDVGIDTNGKTLDEILKELAKKYEVETTTSVSLADEFMKWVIEIDKKTAQELWTYGATPENTDVEGALNTNRKQMQCGSLVSIALIMMGFFTEEDIRAEYGGVQYNSPARIRTALINHDCEKINDENELKPGDIICFWERDQGWGKHIEVFAGYDENGGILVYSSGGTTLIQTEGATKKSLRGKTWEAYRLPEEKDKSNTNLAKEILEKASGTKNQTQTTSTRTNTSATTKNPIITSRTNTESIYQLDSNTINPKWEEGYLDYRAGINDYEKDGKIIRETWCNLEIRRSHALKFTILANGKDEGYWLRDDGVEMFGDYVCVASDIGAWFGSTEGAIYNPADRIETSMGTGIVMDLCGMAVDTRKNGIENKKGEIIDIWYDIYAKPNTTSNYTEDSKYYQSHSSWVDFFKMYPSKMPETPEPVTDWEAYFKDPEGYLGNSSNTTNQSTETIQSATTSTRTVTKPNTIKPEIDSTVTSQGTETTQSAITSTRTINKPNIVEAEINSTVTNQGTETIQSATTPTRTVTKPNIIETEPSIPPIVSSDEINTSVEKCTPKAVLNAAMNMEIIENNSKYLCQILHLSGYFTDEELKKYINSSISEILKYLNERNWYKITNISELKVGDIIIVNDGEEVRVYAGNNSWYIAGKTEVQQGNENWSERTNWVAYRQEQ